MHNFQTRTLLNIGHLADHMLLLIFATAVVPIAKDFGLQRWEDLMPYSVGAFLLFGLGAMPAGRLGDLWGRRPMMIIFFLGIGAASIMVSFTHSPWQIALALTLLGCFASIYHPVGIPMLLESEKRIGRTIGINGLMGNFGVAAAAVTTGFIVKYAGWRAAFVIPGVFCILCGIFFSIYSPGKQIAPNNKKSDANLHLKESSATLLLIMTIAATSINIVFNFSVNSNYEMLATKLVAIAQDPAHLGMLLSGVYIVGSFVQLFIGYMLDKFPIKILYKTIIAIQLTTLSIATFVDGWIFFALQIIFMAAIFGAIPFTDAMLVRYIDDANRSRVAGTRFTIAFSVSSLAVWLTGPIVKNFGFTALLLTMAGASLVALVSVLTLPEEKSKTWVA